MNAMNASGCARKAVCGEALVRRTNRVRDPCCGGDGQGERKVCPGSRLVGRVRWLEAMALGFFVETTRTLATRPDRLGSNTIRGRQRQSVGTAPETCPVPER